MVGLGVLAVQAEVSLPHELKAVVQSGVGERRFEFRLFDDQGIRVDEVQRVFAFGDVARIFQREEVVVKADFGIDGGGRIAVMVKANVGQIGRASCRERV